MRPEAAVDDLLNYEAVPDAEFPQVDFSGLREAYARLRPLLEKMVLFWHGFLVSGFPGTRSAEHMAIQLELFRRMGVGTLDVYSVGAGGPQDLMRKVNVREARRRLKPLLDDVRSGEEVVVLRRGTEVARLVPPRRRAPHLPGPGSLRASVQVRGRPVSAGVIAGRRSARF